MAGTIEKLEKFTFIYDGGLATTGRLDLYDAGTSLLAASRVYALLGHYYETQKIISKAPKSVTKVYFTTAEEGSVREGIYVGIVTTILAFPFTHFADRLLNRWLPVPNPEMELILKQQEENNKLLRELNGRLDQISPPQVSYDALADKFIKEHQTECDVLRSIVSNSVRNIFRPVGHSADHLIIESGEINRPTVGLDHEGVLQLEQETIDDEDVEVIGVVNSFSRGSKAGVLFSKEHGRGFLFTYNYKGKLPDGDDFSWSQYSREPLRLKGRFIRRFDNSIKKFHIHEVARTKGERSEDGGQANVYDIE